MQAFTKYAKKCADSPADVEKELDRIRKYCQVVRVIAHTQVNTHIHADRYTRTHTLTDPDTQTDTQEHTR